MPLERVEYLKMDNPTCTRFALQLERLLFADSPEFCKVIEERYHSTEKVRFLRNVSSEITLSIFINNKHQKCSPTKCYQAYYFADI